VEFVFAVSHTTRPPRPKEVDGVHYHFVDKDSMQHLIDLGKDTNEPGHLASESTSWASSYFVEHANVHGNLYGTSWDAIVKVDGVNQKTIGNTRVIRKAILDIDIQGVQHLKKIEQEQKEEMERGDTIMPFLLQPKYIFIAPPSLQELQERLVARGTESKLSLVARTNNAIHEMNYGLELLRYSLDEERDVLYRKSYNFHTVVVNGVSVNDTVDELMVCVDRIYNIPNFQRPAHVNANKYEPDEPIHIYEEMMYK
jgi:guanylate kinase